MRGEQDCGEVVVGVLGWAGREEEGGLGVEESDAFGVGTAAGHEVAESWREAGKAFGFGRLGASGIADVEDLRAEHEAGDLIKDLGREGDERGGVRGREVAGFWLAVSGSWRKIPGWRGGIVPWGRFWRCEPTLSRSSSGSRREVIVESRRVASSWKRID